MLLETLNQKHKGSIVFSRATDAVVAGFELKPQHGGSVSVSQTGAYTANLLELVTGRLMAAGHEESFKHGTLRCYRQAGALCVAVFSGTRPISRILQCLLPVSAQTGPVDEGMFTWFGPREYIGTAWSDNDPDQCQVITVDRLRHFAAAGKPNTNARAQVAAAESNKKAYQRQKRHKPGGRRH